MSEATKMLDCEERFWNSGKPCTHTAKYLAPANDKAVCGIHARGYLRCIPIAEIEDAVALGWT